MAPKATKKRLHDTPAGERRIGVVLEHLDGKISLVAEQYGDIKDEIGGIKSEIGGIKSEIGGIKSEIGGIKSEIGGIKKTLDSHTEMIGNLATDVAIIKEDVEFIKGSLKKKIDIEEFAALERRVALLERRGR